MDLRLLPLSLLLWSGSLWALAGPGAVPLAEAELSAGDAATLTLAPVDVGRLAAEDEASAGRSGLPYRYGQLQRVREVVQDAERAHGGVWRTLPDGSLQWRLSIQAPGARSLELGFSRFRLPAGARLWLHAAESKQQVGPLTEADNRVDGRYHSVLLGGGELTLELQLPAAKRAHLALQLDQVVYGYRDPFAATQPKSGSCNIDTVCPQGDDYRDQIAATALYTFPSGGSSFACSGTLMATGNRSQDLAAPRFATANHCIDAASEAQGMVFYWGYESPTCRAPGSSASGSQLPRAANTRATQNGATLLATHEATDFTVVQLLAPVPSAARAFFSGWDRSGSTPPASVGIHHPNGHEKRITFNDDPLTLMSSCIIAGGPATSHWRIEQYEAGTTETGSSGSGLWADQQDEPAGGSNEDELFIGVLSGGDASCSNPGGYDCYGRLSQAWEGGATAATRMRDWFDRTGTNPTSLPGMKVCEPPTLTLESPAFSSAPVAGSSVTFTATASGSAGGSRTFSWDVDGDGVFDREGAASTIQVTYPRAQSLQVRVRVSDTEGCDGSLSRALDVLGAGLSATSGAPQQVCGDNDAAIEPGERWKLPVTLRNDGGAPLPAGARALFARAAQSFAPLTTAEFNDNGFGPRDDARTVDPIALGGGGLRLYGQSYAQAFMSTNGYVSFSPAETGADWSNACRGGIDNGAVGPQLRPLHDDLVVSEQSGAGLRYGYFASCPRPAQSTPATQGCHVFQWSRMQWVDSDSLGAPSGDASFQAIVYQPSGQIVYQYLAADTHAGGRATIGVIGGNGDPLDVGCDTPSAAPTGRAVCLFDPGAPPAGGFPAGTLGPNTFGYRGFTNASGDCPFAPVDLATVQTTGAGLRLETPTLAVPALGTGQQASLEVGFAVPESISCGASLALEYIGTAAPGVSSFARSNILSATVGVGSTCQISTACPAQIPAIATRPGFYYNDRRAGNGLANFIYDTVYGGVWYTALPDRSPTWYILNGNYADHLGVMPIRRFRNTAAPAGFAPDDDFVGTVWVAQIDRDSLLHAWQFDDGVRGLELLDATPLPFSNPNHSQTWYSTAESGWGLSIESLMTGPTTALEFMVGYIYDAGGTARWVLGTSDSTSGGTVPVSTYRVHCPGCPWFPDWDASVQSAGSLSRTYTGPMTALFSSQITLPAPLSGSWNRNNLPLTTIGPPAPPGQ